ncbi:MAG: calcium/sodium antiporter [Gemmatimonadota bacterium]|nr:calcium/sodium antiporter [Gemmatimonadota bacterium]
MILDIFLFAVGITALTLGADWLVRGASALAQQLGVSHLVIGLTVVAFGTSAPELVVSGSASLAGEPDVAVGNVMGSTVANVGLIVGIGSLLRPIVVHRSLLVRETPLVILVLTLVMVFSLNGNLGRVDGALLLLAFTLYLLFLLRWGGGRLDEIAREVEAETIGEAVLEGTTAKGDDAAADQGVEDAGFATAVRTRSGPLWSILQIVVGLPLLLIGARWLIHAALSLAATFNVPDAVIAATMIAVGTSLPELASTVAAALRGMGDIAIGNVIGSNVFNLGLVLGTAAVLRPLELSSAVVVGQVLPALIFSILLIPLALSKEQVGRWEGGFLLTGYVVYVGSILLF